MVRELTAGELGAVAAMGHEFYRVAGLPGRIVPEVFCRNWAAFLAAGLGVVLGIHGDGLIHRGDAENAEKTGELIGVIGALLVPDVNDGVLVCSEMFWWVKPEARGRGMELLAGLEAWALAKGAERMSMVALRSSMAERLRRVYERRGFRELETHFVKRLE